MLLDLRVSTSVSMRDCDYAGVYVHMCPPVGRHECDHALGSGWGDCN